ncbi:30S ribosomal protein S6 [Chlamydiales bacterium]|nr:30S ribosomal protein S6 [Chlamydiales bacterium]
MKEEKMCLYEGMYVIKANISDEAKKGLEDQLKTLITSRGGEIKKEHDMGRRRLSYEINKHKEGNYFLLYFNLAPSGIKDLWKEYHLMEDLLRFVTLRTEEVLEKLEFKSLAEH